MLEDSKKTLLIVLGLILMAGLLFGIRSVLRNSPPQPAETSSARTVGYPIQESFHSLDLETGSGDILVCLSTDGSCHLDCVENESVHNTVEVRGGVLSLRQEIDTQFSFGFSAADRRLGRVTVYLPEAAYEALRIKTGSGDQSVDAALRFSGAELTASSGDIDFAAAVDGDLNVSANSGDVSLYGPEGGDVRVETGSGEIGIEGLKARSLEVHSNSGEQKLRELSVEGAAALESGSGDIRIDGLRAQSLETRSNSGEQKLIDVITEGLSALESSSGSLTLEHCDAGEYRIRANSGSVRGELLSGKRFQASSNSGSVHVPEDDASGGLCSVKTTSGEIRISVR